MLGRPVLLTAEHAREIVGFYNAKTKEGVSIEGIAGLLADDLGITISAARQRLWKARKMVLEAPAAAAAPAEESTDPVELRRYKIKLEDAQKQLKKLEERLVKTEDVRGQLMDLGPLRVSEIRPDKSEPTGRRAVILHISDIQYGEVIDFDAIGGVNSYNIEIANARIQRLFQKAHRFITDLWHGDPPEEVVILLNGDMISGSIHHELDKTDEVGPLEQAHLVAAQLAAGIKLIADEGFPVRVISTPGNHGRTTLKPESKNHVFENLDTMVATKIESELRSHELVEVFYSRSDIDAVFDVFGFPMLATHGDRMGSRGGTGFVGPMANIVKGHQKLMSDHGNRGTQLYRIFTGHFHTPGVTSHGYANGTMAGPSEYSRDGRMTMTPPQQDYFVIHDEHGIIQQCPIFVGDPSEGSICSPKQKFQSKD